MSTTITRQRFWLLAVLVLALAALTGMAFLGDSTAAPAAVPHTQDGGTIELVSHFGGGMFSLAVPPGGNYAYLGEGSALTIMDVSDRSLPAPVGRLLLFDEVDDIALEGDIAYLANIGDGLTIVDTSNPISPTLIGGYDTPGSATGVYVDGTLAYVADSDGGLQIINVSEPSNPTLVGSYHTPERARDVWVAGNYAYVTTDWTDGWLRVVDVSDPTNPHEVGAYDTPGDAYGVYVAGSTAYVADGWEGGLLILDVSNPASPALLGSYDTPGGAEDVQVVGAIAYVADREEGLQIINVTNPASPTLIATSDAAWDASRVALSGSHAYLADANKGLRILDVSDPASPDIVGTYDQPGIIMDVFVPDTATASLPLSGKGAAGDNLYAYLVDMERLWTVDVSNPADPNFPAAFTLQGLGRHLYVSGSLAYVAEWAWLDGLEIVNVADPLNPTLAGQYLAPDDAEVNDVFVAGSYAYVPMVSGATWPRTDGWLRIVDVSDAVSPTEVGAYDTPGDARRAFVGDSIAYVADGEAGLRLLDVSDPANPVELGHADPPTGATTDAVYVAGDRAYVGSSAGEWPDIEGWFQMLDVSDPANPVVLDTFAVDGVINDIEVRGEDAVLAVGGDGVWWLNVAESQIGLIAKHEAPTARAIAIFQESGSQRLLQLPVVRTILKALKSHGGEIQRTVPRKAPTRTPTVEPTPTVTVTPTPECSVSGIVMPPEARSACWVKPIAKPCECGTEPVAFTAPERCGDWEFDHWAPGRVLQCPKEGNAVNQGWFEPLPTVRLTSQ